MSLESKLLDYNKSGNKFIQSSSTKRQEYIDEQHKLSLIKHEYDPNQRGSLANKERSFLPHKKIERNIKFSISNEDLYERNEEYRKVIKEYWKYTYIQRASCYGIIFSFIYFIYQIRKRKVNRLLIVSNQIKNKKKSGLFFIFNSVFLIFSSIIVNLYLYYLMHEKRLKILNEVQNGKYNDNDNNNKNSFL